MRREIFLSIYSLVGCNSRQYDDVTIEAKIADDGLWSEMQGSKEGFFHCSPLLLVLSEMLKVDLVTLRVLSKTIIIFGTGLGT